MKKAATRLDYAVRIERVSGHIARNLDQPLDLARLAAVACFSPYHFHRLYRLVLGETPDQTVRRLRLHRSAAALSRNEGPLARIARETGYGSAEAFSRAFAAAYGQPPATYRAKRASPPAAPGAPEITDMYEVTVKHFAGLSLAGLPHRGDYQAIGSTFERLYAWAAPRGLLGPGTRVFGVYYDDPASVPAADLRSFAAISVDPGFVPEGEIELVALAAGEVASVVHKGPYAELETAYRHLYAQWLPSSGREPADRPCFEEYLNDPRQHPPTEWLTEVFLPLVG